VSKNNYIQSRAAFQNEDICSRSWRGPKLTRRRISTASRVQFLITTQRLIKKKILQGSLKTENTILQIKKKRERENPSPFALLKRDSQEMSLLT
jgi:hypothetical protein